MKYNKIEILNELDLAFDGEDSFYYPDRNEGDIKYNFFLDLEHGYFETASSKIHLYGDDERWAIVFEKSGYQNRARSIDIELNYVGNCIDFLINKYPERSYITNTKSIELISFEELDRIENKSGSEMECFELIDKSITEIEFRGDLIELDLDAKKYRDVGIELREHGNPQNLIGFGDLIRYIFETNPEMIHAREDEIKSQLPDDLPKIMTIDDFYHLSFYDGNHLPSNIETYQLIAEVLFSRDSKNWTPTLKGNNHWSNWKSGNL